MKRLKKILIVTSLTAFVLSFNSCIIMSKDSGNKGKGEGNKKEHHDNGKHKGEGKGKKK